MIKWVPNPACMGDPKLPGNYRYPYHEILHKIYVEQSYPEIPYMKRLILDDLFFVVCFILEIPNCDQPFVVDMCKMVERGPDGWCMDLWARYHWKDIDVNTPVLTEAGWKKHGCLEVGDRVFTPEGKFATVIGVQHFTSNECYKMTFDNKVEIVCGSGHLWKVEMPSRKRVPGTKNKRVPRETRIVETHELAKIKSLFHPVVAITKPIEYPEQNLPVDPYVLGVWLGDGSKDDGRITNQDPEIFAEIEKRGYYLSSNHCPQKNPLRTSTIYKVSPQLRCLDVLGSKHIPDQYLVSSVSQRLQLLQGLIDTDGSVSKTNRCVTFTQKSFRLAEQVKYLAISLGFKARLTPVRSADAWDVTFQVSDSDLIPCLLPRKATLITNGKRRIGSKGWRIQSIEKVASTPTNCIKIDSEDGMYLIGKELIPTHNTTIKTKARTIQRIVKYPDKCTMIASHTRPIAKKMMRPIMQVLENSDLLKRCFPEVLYQNPRNESPKWALAVETPVLTVDGWKPHGDLRVGDKIFGSKGQVVTVVGVSGTMLNADCRKISFDDCELIASAEHLWPVQCKKTTSGAWEKEPLIEIIKTENLLPKSRMKRMLPTPSVQIPSYSSPAPLDPYILGLFLGDGTAGTNIISVASEDEENFLSQIRAMGFGYYVHRKRSEDNFSMWGIKGLKEFLFPLGCLSKKHIPDRYLFGTELERLSLLQGLMDSDGTCKKDGPSRCHGMCMFSNTNHDLAQGVFYLAASLGLRPSMLSHMPKQRGRLRIYQVYFIGLKDIPPFRSPRKLAHCKDKRHKVGRYIRSIEKIQSVPVNCIRVDAEDSLYLAGTSMVPTHNSEDDGIVVKRQNMARSEATVEAWGIKEGMPISVHFDWILLDDLETKDDVRNPDVIQHGREAFDLCNFLITNGGSIDVTGTPYSHQGIYIPFIKEKVDSEEKPRYTYRAIPATKDGTKDGEPVMMTKKQLADIYSDMTKEEGSLGEYIYNCQLLINPTPVGVRKLSGDLIQDIDPKEIPKNIYKFMPIDPAGDDKNGKGDAWAAGVVGIDPKQDDLGANNIYIVDLLITPMREEEAPLELARMYRRNGFIMQVGVEKVGLSTAEIHVANALAKFGIYISVEKQTLIILRPGGMDNRARIEKALPWPLFNGKIFISTEVPAIYRDRLRMEMDKFPFWHDDGLTMLAYFYTMVKDYHFGWWGGVEDDEDNKSNRVVPMRRNAVTGY